MTDWRFIRALCRLMRRVERIWLGRKALLRVCSFHYFSVLSVLPGCGLTGLLHVERLGTTHWPNAVHVGSNTAMRDGKPCEKTRDRPVQEPVLNERTFKLTGIPYIKQSA